MRQGASAGKRATEGRSEPASGRADESLRCFLRSPLSAEELCGERLHREVSFERWCVTREDLGLLRHDLDLAVSRGIVRPAAPDASSEADDRSGPNIYDVVDQFIKPLSRLAGNTSWALMRHPAGLPCDLFVTHAWVEGIFEFVDKVLESWPPGTLHAYCCMLSNPQTLDIGAMLSSPQESPFARSLASASCMLVVPNHQVSVYTRVWCVYEAYLATQQDKSLLTALPPLVPDRRRYLAVAGLWILGALAALMLNSEQLGVTEEQILFPVSLATTVGLQRYIVLSCAGVERQSSMLLFCAGVSGLGFGLAVTAVARGQEWLMSQVWAAPPGSPWRQLSIAVFSLEYCSPCVDLLAEYEYQRNRRLAQQSAQLSRGFTGRVVHAQTSNPEDKQRIIGEILEISSLQEVEGSLEVLFTAGLSTRDLRRAARQGVRACYAACWSPVIVTSCCCWLLVSFPLAVLPCDRGWFIIVLLALVDLEVFVWVFCYARAQPDRRNWGQKCLLAPTLGLFVSFIVVDLSASGVLHEKAGVSCCAASLVHEGTAAQRLLRGEVMLIALFAMPIAIVLLLLGPGSMPRLARLLLGREGRPASSDPAETEPLVIEELI